MQENRPFFVCNPNVMNKTKLSLSLLFILLVAGVFLAGFYAAKPHEVRPVEVAYHPRYLSNDSLSIYLRRAYVDNDPDAQFIIAAAAWLKDAGVIPDSIYTVPLDETPMLLYNAALQGHPQAIQAVRFMIANDQWHLPLPQDRK